MLWGIIPKTMSFSPEIGKIPSTIGVFFEAGLFRPIFFDLLRGRRRDFYSDATDLLRAYEKHVEVRMKGIENIAPENGGLVVFNHPETSMLLPSFSKLMIEISRKGRKTVFVVGSEIPLFDRFDRYPLPFSVLFSKRIHNMYPNEIISVPTSRMRRDFLTGRVAAARCVEKHLKKGDFVVISPEGHVETGNTISPKKTFHVGSGQLAIFATKHQIPINPVAIWKENNDTINVEVGRPFYTLTDDRIEAVNDLMGHIAALLPDGLRGPFREKQMEKVFAQ